VHAVEFIEQIEDDAGAEAMNSLDVTLATEATLGLISEDFANIYSARILQSTRPESARQRLGVFSLLHRSSRRL
jgi:hypothetical protein